MRPQRIQMTWRWHGLLACCLVVACTASGQGRRNETQFSEIMTKLQSAAPRDYSKELNQTEENLVTAVKQQNPQEVSDQEIDDLATLLKHPNMGLR